MKEFNDFLCLLNVPLVLFQLFSTRPQGCQAAAGSATESWAAAGHPVCCSRRHAGIPSATGVLCLQSVRFLWIRMTQAEGPKTCKTLWHRRRFLCLWTSNFDFTTDGSYVCYTPRCLQSQTVRFLYIRLTLSLEQHYCTLMSSKLQHSQQVGFASARLLDIWTCGVKISALP